MSAGMGVNMSRKRKNKKNIDTVNANEVVANNEAADGIEDNTIDVLNDAVSTDEGQQFDETVRIFDETDSAREDTISMLEESSPVVFSSISGNEQDYAEGEYIQPEGADEIANPAEYYEEISENIADYAEDEYYAEESEVDYPDEFEEAEYSLGQEKHDGSFGGFLKEFFHHVGEIISKNKIIVAAVVAVIAITVIIVVVLNNNRTTQSSLSDNEIASTSINSAMFIPQDPYEENAYPAVNELVTRYLTAKQDGDIQTIRQLRNYISTSEEIKIEVLSQYIDSYQNINCYTKIGPYENSYVVYVYCELKLKDYDVLSPYLITLLVCTGDDGSMYIYSGDFDSNVASYIYEISSQDDVKDLFSRVDTEYADVLANNAEFAEYKTAMKEMVKEEVAAKLAEIAIVSENEVEETVSEDQISEDVTDETNEDEPFEVKATTTVNVRVSDSEDADKLDMLSAGAVVTCNVMQPNGWSQIDFNGQTGYVKTEYLERVDNNDEAATDGGRTVRCNDTVNIRESASTTANSLGVAYVGDSFTLVEELSNGWSKILYNGQEAYVKSEYLD